jgi:hypothetical protein
MNNSVGSEQLKQFGEMFRNAHLLVAGPFAEPALPRELDEMVRDRADSPVGRIP